MFFDVKISGHTIGKIMEGIVRHQTKIILSERPRMKIEEKIGYSGKKDDIRTTGDTESEKKGIEIIQQCFPGFGIISEESGITPCTLTGAQFDFTIDPIDGTKAYVRNQSDGFGPMIALLSGNEVIAAYIGDAMTGEIYGFHPDSEHLKHIKRIDIDEDIRDVHNKKLRKTFVLLRNNPYELSETAQKMFRYGKKSLFSGLNINSGGIGLSMAKIWRGEFGAIIIKVHTLTPWDMCPVIGICNRFGYVFLEIKDGTLEAIDLTPPRRTKKVSKEILIIHEKYLPELFIWAQANL